METAKQMSFDEYLEFEKTSEVRHEFADGFVFAMVGASNVHHLIASSVFARTYLAATRAGCRAYMDDMKLRTPSDKGYYPDVFVTCDPKDFATDLKPTACFIRKMAQLPCAGFATNLWSCVAEKQIPGKLSKTTRWHLAL
jgi:Uma2 family endonuclease